MDDNGCEYYDGLQRDTAEIDTKSIATMMVQDEERYMEWIFGCLLANFSVLDIERRCCCVIITSDAVGITMKVVPRVVFTSSNYKIELILYMFMDCECYVPMRKKGGGEIQYQCSLYRDLESTIRMIFS